MVKYPLVTKIFSYIFYKASTLINLWHTSEWFVRQFTQFYIESYTTRNFNLLLYPIHRHHGNIATHLFNMTAKCECNLTHTHTQMCEWTYNNECCRDRRKISTCFLFTTNDQGWHSQQSFKGLIQKYPPTPYDFETAGSVWCPWGMASAFHANFECWSCTMFVSLSAPMPDQFNTVYLWIPTESCLHPLRDSVCLDVRRALFQQGVRVKIDNRLRKNSCQYSQNIYKVRSFFRVVPHCSWPGVDFLELGYSQDHWWCDPAPNLARQRQFRAISTQN